jgi:hypothetical protein
MSDKLKYQAKWPVLTRETSYEVKNKGAFLLLFTRKNCILGFSTKIKIGYTTYNIFFR